MIGNLALFRLTSLLLVPIFISLIACGGGKSEPSTNSGGAPETGNGNNSGGETGNTGTAGSTTASFDLNAPLNESQCSEISQFVWREGQCFVSGNPAVEKVHLLRALPEGDRESLITWLTSLEKTGSFEAIFPNWEDGTSNGSELTTGPESPSQYIDSNLFSMVHGESNFLHTNEGTLILSSPSLDNRFFTLSSSRQHSIDNTLIEYKEASITIDSSHFVINLFGEEIYRFNPITQLRISAHIKTQQSAKQLDEPYTLEINHATSMPNATLQGHVFIDAVLNSIKADDNSKTLLRNVLGLSAKFDDNDIVFADDIGLSLPAFRLDKGEEHTSLFSTTHNTVYMDKTQAESLVALNTLSTSINALFRSRAIPLLQLTDSESLLQITAQFDADASEDETLSSVITTPYLLSEITSQIENIETYTLDVESTQIEVPVLPLNAFTELNKRIDAIQDSADILFVSPSQWQAYPNYSDAIAPLSILIENEATFSRLLVNNEETKERILNMALPPYYPLVFSPTSDDVLDMGWWRRDLKNLVDATLDNVAEDTQNTQEYLSIFSLWFEDKAAESQTGGFYPLLHQKFLSIFSSLNPELFHIYRESLSLFIIELAYRGQLERDELMSDEVLVAAIDAAGLEFSELLIPEIESAGRPIYQPLESRWQFDESALQRIKITSELLSDSFKTRVREHDSLANQFAIDDIATRIYSLYDTVENLNAYLDQKTTALTALETFSNQDSTKISSQELFTNGLTRLAERAYDENWNMQTYTDLATVISFSYPRGIASEASSCQQSSLIEITECQRRLSADHYARLTTTLGQGYLASYEGGQKPYVVNADIFIEIDEAIAQIEALRNTSLNSVDIDFELAIENGIWLSCDLDELQININEARASIADYLALVEQDPLPPLFSDAYNLQQNTKNDFLEIIDRCPRSE